MGHKHIAIFNIPAHGHINPTLALTASLVKRGYRVTYPVTDEFVKAVEETGAEPLNYRSTLNIDPQQIRELMKNKKDMSQAPLMFIKKWRRFFLSLKRSMRMTSQTLSFLTLWPWRENCWLRSLE